MRTGRYVPALDGVRGLAVVAVLLFHGGVPWARGGFLGVDAFFVLSGYLITTLLLDNPDLRSFWARRARRLLPALAVFVPVTLLLGVVLNAPFRDALASAVWLSNWRFMSGGYFAATAEPSAFRHTWSLAVEGQFYVVWPVVVVLVCRRSRFAVLAVASVGACASAVVMATLWTPYGDPARAYYGTDTRAQALLVGAALAVVLAGRTATLPRRAFLSLSGLFGAVVLGMSWRTASGGAHDLYGGGFLLVAVATAAVIASVVAVPRGPLARALSLRPLTAIGRVSYGIYLWHWPVFLLLTRSRTGLGGWPLLAERVVVTGVLATLSWRYVETRTWHVPRLARAGLAVAVALSLVVVLRPAPEAAPEPVAVRAPVTVTPSPSATPVRHTGRVAIVGDSVAYTLAQGLGNAVVNDATLGCGLVTGGPYRYFGGQYAARPECDAWPETWTKAARDADVVAVLVGRWEVMDRKRDGVWTHVGEPAFDAYLTGEVERALTVLAPARVVLLTAPYYHRGERPDGGRWPEDDPARVDAFNAILRSVAARHDGVRVVDLNARLSPDGHYTRTLNGVVVRYDGVHVSPAGARLIEPWLVAALTA